MRIVLTACLAVTMLAGCARDDEDRSRIDRDAYRVDIRWTDYGIPHIEAEDWASLGYGVAYATAHDAICVLAEEIVTVRGERARFFGAHSDGVDNVANDVFQRLLIDPELLAHHRTGAPREIAAMNRGYRDGYNRWLADHIEHLPERCADAPWVGPITEDDVTRMAIWVGIRYGLGRAAAPIIAAAPPTHATTMVSKPASEAFGVDDPPHAALGSNAYAFGSELTENGRGLLFGNPHYPWKGPSRFHMKHLRIPGELDVMGVGLYTTNAVAIGFTSMVAWTHTVSTALRFTLYRLELDPEDPTRYRYGDETRSMTSRDVEVSVLTPDGELQPERRRIWMSHHGPILAGSDLPWTEKHAFALRDANLRNNRSGAQYLRFWRARSVEDIRDALAEVQGVSWTNTVAADRRGGALYADITVVPNVDRALIDACSVTLENAGVWSRAVTLDGSRPECAWREDPAAAEPGILPPAELPYLITRRYVSNSNDSHWLSSPEAPLEGFSPIIGDERTARSLRTRAGLVFVEEVLYEQRRFTPKIVQDILYEHRNYGASLLLDDVLELCSDLEGTPARACEVLRSWDRRHGVDSRGAHVWTEFWRHAGRMEHPWTVTFDPEDPVATPAGLRLQDAAVREGLTAALTRAVETLDEANIALDAPLGEIQYVMRNGEKIGIPGGEGWAGAFSMIVTRLRPDEGYTPVTHGNSYIQVVTWDDAGAPDARAILTYSQSQEPDSPHYADQTRLYSEGGWLHLPFTRAQIEQANTLRKVTLEASRH